MGVARTVLGGDFCGFGGPVRGFGGREIGRAMLGRGHCDGSRDGFGALVSLVNMVKMG